MEGSLTFSFQSDCQASKYDEWSFYRKQFQSVAGGSKGIDILCVDRDTSWLIEIKDYREYYRSKTTDISNEIANKVRDTLAGLAAAAKMANDANQRELAQKALATSRWKVVLHLEQSAEHRLRQKEPIDRKRLLFKLQTELKAIDARPIICDRSTAPRWIPWKVESRAVQ